jgi:hypothetical protein
MLINSGGNTTPSNDQATNSLAVLYEYYDMMPERRNSSLLGNGLLNTFPRKRTRATVEERCLLRPAPRTLLLYGAVNTSAAVNQHATIEEAVFSVGATPRLYNEDFTQLE